jgi:hypothetical protein
MEGTVRVLASAAFERYRDAVAVAFAADGWNGKPAIAVNGGKNVPVYWCGSVLEFRERLADATPEEPVILLTSQPEPDLGQDALCLLAGQRLRKLGVWEPLMAAFNASTIAPPVRRNEELGAALMRVVPSAGYEPAPNGVITAEYAWSELARAVLGVAPAGPVELMTLVAKPEIAPKFAPTADEKVNDLLPDLIDSLHGPVGPAAGPILSAAAAGYASQLVPLGLAAEVVFSAHDASALAEAVGRFERFFSVPITAQGCLEMASAARGLVEVADEPQSSSWAQSAEEILQTVKAEDFAWISSTLPSGFEQRLERFGEAIELPAAADRLPTVREALGSVLAHALAARSKRRVRAAQMAGRLWLFLTGDESVATSFGDAATRHVREGGFVDLAREAFDQEEPSTSLAAAYGSLVAEVDSRREARSITFAQLLAAATGADSLGPCVPVEDALRAVVLPLALVKNVLLVVLDGLSEAVYRSVGADLQRRGWSEVDPDGGARAPMVAVLPSVTKFSRTSLLAGRRTSGAQAVERDGMDEVLRPAGRSALHHKADLSDRDGIAEDVADQGLTVVGVVINAIDDLLDKGDQLYPDWSVDAIGPLGWLLAEAESSGRAVVIAGDHGHVLERGTEYRPDDGGGSRWRLVEPSADPVADEVRLEGPRVLAGDGAVICPAVEGVRYRRRSAGYHGGATPQEVITPLAVLLPPGVEVDGWRLVNEAEPDWWLLEEDVPVHVTQLPSSSRGPVNQEALFGEAQRVQAPKWIDDLLQTDLYRSNKERQHRPPPEEKVIALLEELERKSFVAADSAAARVLRVPQLRVAGVVASIQPLLNVEGYQVLSRDRETGEIRLDRESLRAQFGV